MFRIIATAWLTLITPALLASPLPFLSPETSKDAGLKGSIKSSKSTFHCKERPLEEFNETSASYSETGLLLSRSSISQNLNHFLHPQAGMGSFEQDLDNGKLKKYTVRNDFNGSSTVVTAEVIRWDSRYRPKVVKVKETSTSLEGESRTWLGAHTFSYNNNLVVLKSKLKAPGSPAITFNSVIEMDNQNRITKYTVEDPFTKKLQITHSASYEDDKVTGKNVDGRSAEFEYNESGELTSVSTLSGLGLANSIVHITDIKKDKCGNNTYSTLNISSPMKDKLDELFDVQRSAADIVNDGSISADQDSENFRLPNCDQFEMIGEYTYYNEC